MEINLPSVQQTCKHPFKTSGKYSFIPTTRVLGVLADYGWTPIEARQSRVLDPQNDGFQRHLVRLRNERVSGDLVAVGDVVPEIVMVNSHGGSSSFQLYASLLEKVCGNGLIIDRPAADYRIPHLGYADGKVSEAIVALAEMFSQVLAVRAAWQSIPLDRLEQFAFGREATVIRFGEQAATVDPLDLLKVRHAGQGEPTLWNTFNIVQEATLRGGVRRRHPKGKWTFSRAVNAIDDSIRLNRALWRLAEEVARRHEG
jgi:hypothetical protein